MHASVAAPAQLARQGDAATLATLLQAQRRGLLAAHAQLPERLPPQPGWNLPLWERGHVAWFAERWTQRQPAPERGPRCDPAAPLPTGRCPDALYDSSAVPHAQRWQLPLPDAAATQALLDAQLDATLQRLAGQPHDDAALYLYRLALLHEAMHEEAAWLTARQLGLATPAVAPASAAGELCVPATCVPLGHAGPGFAFDNELQPHPIEVAAFRIDARPLRWAELLPWAHHAYRDDRLWSPAGLAWRGAREQPDALLLEPDPDPALAAEGLNAHEAEAWCRWAGRRLAHEAEWLAACRQPGFAWGEVWEWTADPFAPFAGFAPHPYRDYSQPWFDGCHRLLKGASRCTPAVLRDPRFRNFYLPERTDLLAGLRTVALA
jgi:EgtB-related family protein